MASASRDVLLETAEALVIERSEQADRIIVVLKQQKTLSSPVLGKQVNGMGVERKEYESRS